MEHEPFSGPEWRTAFSYAAEGQRWELDLTRMVVALLTPVALSFYSGRLALAVAVPCVAVFCWFLSRAVRGS